MTPEQVERIYLTARRAINELAACGRAGMAEDMADLEHKLWALGMYADEGRIQTENQMKQEAA